MRIFFIFSVSHDIQEVETYIHSHQTTTQTVSTTTTTTLSETDNTPNLTHANRVSPATVSSLKL